eukprot:TRINITY_DN7832_c0_g1_i1.p1 TRINITY_DN7832_c0_g1~~TRINITY_DN7832_c0_g1_i1.p1  ORF type:complete len:306 (-),score=63.08 TRINITY_DN7832_c0_g1_i1:36-953(-)
MLHDYSSGSLYTDTESSSIISDLIIIDPQDHIGFFNMTNQEKVTWKKLILNKGFISNVFTFLVLLLGAGLVMIDTENEALKLFFQFVLAFGMYGFAGGLTNWLAIKMLFDRIPFLIGSGVIENKFVEIRKSIKDTILNTFFDSDFLEQYINQKTGQVVGSLNIEEKIATILESPVIDEVIDMKLRELHERPEGMWLTMMGLNASQLKPMIKPFILGLGHDTLPMLVNNFEPANLVSLDKIRGEIDTMMSQKLKNLGPKTVKKLLEDVIRDHLGWLIVWGNIFGGILGIISKLAQYIAETYGGTEI